MTSKLLDELEKALEAATTPKTRRFGKTVAEIYDNEAVARLEELLYDYAPQLLAVCRAAEKCSDNLGRYHYWRCKASQGAEELCDCGARELGSALSALGGGEWSG